MKLLFLDEDEERDYDESNIVDQIKFELGTEN